MYQKFWHVVWCNRCARDDVLRDGANSAAHSSGDSKFAMIRLRAAIASTLSKSRISLSGLHSFLNTTGITMDSSELDTKIEFAERKVLVLQNRVIEAQNKAMQFLKKLEQQAEEHEEMKKEWMKKRNAERERHASEMNELKATHRRVIEDLRIRFEQERAAKLKDLKALIEEEENQLKGLHIRRAEVVSKTRTEEAHIKSKYQEKLNTILRDEQSASRKGVVRQKRLLGDTQNIFSMSLERNQGVGMKRRPFGRF